MKKSKTGRTHIVGSKNGRKIRRQIKLDKAQKLSSRTEIENMIRAIEHKDQQGLNTLNFFHFR